MKQLTIICSPELTDRVVSVLGAHDLEGFLEVGEVTGNLFETRDPLSRTLTWDGVMLQTWVRDDAVAKGLASDLVALRKDCASHPCLRFYFSPAEEVV